jgi:hypothetical protein
MADQDLPPTASRRPVVIDPHNVPTVFVDWIVTTGQLENVVNMTFGVMDHSLKTNEDELANGVHEGQFVRCFDQHPPRYPWSSSRGTRLSRAASVAAIDAALAMSSELMSSLPALSASR